MPTHDTHGVTASLTVSSLEATICDTIVMRMGKSWQTEAERINAELRHGRKLPEHAVTQTNSGNGNLQYLGHDGDMSFLMVEAGEHINVDPALREYTQSSPNVAHETGGDGSGNGSDGSDKARNGDYDMSAASNTIMMASLDDLTTNSVDEQQGTQNGLGNVQIGGTKALSLVVNYGGATYGREHRKATTNNLTKDLKFEIYLNGDLVEVVYDNWRRASGAVAKRGGTKVFSGTRFHRQAEKPWTYESYPPTPDSNGAARRWTQLNEAHTREAERRGQDVDGEMPITAKYLMALSQLVMPDRIKLLGTDFSVIDIIITAGDGSKFGPGTSYQRGPTRMTDHRFLSNIPEMPRDSLTARFRSAAGDKTLNAGKSLASLSILQHGGTHAEHRLIPVGPETFYEIVQQLPVELKTMKCAKGYGRSNERTIAQRMGDMVKMSPKRQRETLDGLKDDVSQEHMHLMEAALEFGMLEQRQARSSVTQADVAVHYAQPDDAGLDLTGSEKLDMQIDPMLFAETPDADGRQSSITQADVSLHCAQPDDAGLDLTGPGKMDMQIDPMLFAETQASDGWDAGVQLQQDLPDVTMQDQSPVGGSQVQNLEPLQATMALGYSTPAVHLPSLEVYGDPFIASSYNASPFVPAAQFVCSNGGSGSLDFSSLVAAQDRCITVDPKQLMQSSDPADILPNTTSNTGEDDASTTQPPDFDDIIIEGVEVTASNKTTMERMIDLAMDYGCQPDGPLLGCLDPTLAERVPRRPPGSAIYGINVQTPAKHKGGRPRKRPVEEPANESEVDPSWSAQATPNKRRKTGSTIQTRNSHKPVVQINSISEEDTPTRAKATPLSTRKALQSGTPKPRQSIAEESIAQALEHFEIPAMCVGSAVSYAMGNVQRQIKKERLGSFREESLVVGMRFVVI
ncbi:hypothetical protein B0A48_03475 [Cryoendolithus antarcticus]|uniref:Uncharacterized protein n=1 Tax=Cryoendolithus antarcticus TaxID=1507870 RepID=A0A1V8TKI3_9PEZI|nr:hypothetical protein B0A48_03475 [Cryoendolithus antarcticus]